MSTQQTVTEEQVYAALKKCMDPEIPVNVVDLGLIYGVKVADGKDVDIKMTMTTRGCPLEKMNQDVREKLGFGKPKLRFQIDYEKSKPTKTGRFSKQDDGSIILANNKDQGFMVNEAIVEFWNACDGTKTINQITDQFSAKLGLPRQQVEQEAVQLLQQLLEAELLKA
jgi:metal-sulfur cluster biosynthetic enzyme